MADKGAAMGDAAMVAADVDAAPAPKRMIGAVSEEEFRAMHQLSPDQATPLMGKDVVVGGARAYLSLPPGMSAPMPAVIVVHEWWGLNDHIRLAADRLAAQGMAALAVDLYGGNVATTPEQAGAYMKSVDLEIAKKVLKAGADYLKDDPEIKATKRGAIGWCMGGGYSLQAALAVPNLDADVVFYGFVPTDEKSLKPLKAPLLAIFGTEDKSIPKETVDAFEATLKKLKKDAKVERFPAGHAFANPSQPTYNSDVAKAAWADAIAFLDAKLGAKPVTNIPTSTWTAPVGTQGAAAAEGTTATPPGGGMKGE
jgi:carboxymethylenebutenolidase